MREAVIVAATRSAVGKAIRGVLAETRPDDMAAGVVKNLMAGAPAIDGAEIDDLILGCSFPEAEQGMNFARQVVFLSGLPDSVPAMSMNRFCSSGLEAIHIGALKVMAGDADCVIAGGSESMSLIPMGGGQFKANPHLAADRPGSYLGMGLTAERVAEQYKIGREEQDAFAVESHRRALAAQTSGRFDAEITPLMVEHSRPAGRLTKVQRNIMEFKADEGPRADTSLEALARLKPAFKAGGTVTAGNSSQMSDGAAALLVTSTDFAKKKGLKPLVRYIAYATAGLAPELMGLGPIYAVPKVLKRAGLKLADMDLIELNEAFAAQSLAVLRELKLDTERVNVNGGAIALGHPLGCTGAKLTVQAIHELHRRGGRYTMVTMCVGGGMGAAGIFERMEA